MPSSKNLDTPSPAQPIKLSIKGLGEICSFKNSKLLARGRLITDPKKQEKMDRYIQSIKSQLYSELRTRGIAISTGCSPQSLIASFMPLDDSRQWIPEIHVSCVDVEKGEEGCDILIEKI